MIQKRRRVGDQGLGMLMAMSQGSLKGKHSCWIFLYTYLRPTEFSVLYLIW